MALFPDDRAELPHAEIATTSALTGLATRTVRADADSRSADRTPGWLRTSAGWSWRLVAVGLALFLFLRVLGRLLDVVLALFLALVFSALARPLVQRLDRWLPRWLSVLLTFALATALVVLTVAFVVNSVTGQWSGLVSSLQTGITNIESWLTHGPLKLSQHQIGSLAAKANAYLSAHGSTIAVTALTGISNALGYATVAVLALFASIFFVHSGEEMWSWFIRWWPAGGRRERLDESGRVAWRTFAFYVRGIVLVAASDAAVVGISLALLSVPLAPALMVLVFVAAFVPIIGAPIAMLVAALVALAAKGPVVALVVIVLIVAVGQLEGHVFQPFILGRQVSLHPLVVVLAVAIGTISAGFVGALLSVPICSVVWAVTRYLVPERLEAPPGEPPVVDQPLLARPSSEVPDAEEAAEDADARS